MNIETDIRSLIDTVYSLSGQLNPAAAKINQRMIEIDQLISILNQLLAIPVLSSTWTTSADVGGPSEFYELSFSGMSFSYPGIEIDGRFALGRLTIHNFESPGGGDTSAKISFSVSISFNDPILGMRETWSMVAMDMSYFATQNTEGSCGPSRDYFNVPSLGVNLHICEGSSRSFAVYGQYDSPLRIVAIEALPDDFDQDTSVETIKYLLDVIGGEGSDVYSESEMVSAVANIPNDKEFVRWEFNQNLAIDETSEKVVFSMPSEPVTLKAILRPKREIHELIVIGGSGSGTYPSGIEVPIVADEKQGFKFSHWSGDTSSIINNEMAQSFVIVDKDIDIQAEYVEGKTSSVNDPSGDAEPAYLDVISAEVIETGDSVQFSMTMAGDVPQPIEPTTYLWLIDTDKNQATGQTHKFIGSEYNIRLANYDGLWQGWIDVINQGSPGGGSGSVFINGSTVSILVKKAQIGSPASFNWEIDTFSDSSGGDEADAYATMTLSQIINGISKIKLSPNQLILRNGQTTGTVNVLAFDDQNNSVSLNGRKIEFFSTNPSVATVDNSGVVKGTGFGSTEITARVDSIISSDTTQVMLGRCNLIPPILLLSVKDNSTGQLTVNIENADGTAGLLSGKTIEFTSTSSEVASVSDNGVITAHRPPQNFGETPYINVKINGIAISNASVIRVTETSLGLSMISLPGEYVTFYIAQQIGDYNYKKIFAEYEVVRITDIAYRLESELTGIRPSNGDIQYLVNDPGHDDGTVPCGRAGNPIRLGTNVDSGTSCLDAPHWGVFFHEMGHNFTLASRRFADFVKNDKKGDYAEGLATLVNLYVIHNLIDNPSSYNLSDLIRNTLQKESGEVFLEALNRYVEAGSEYSTITPDILDGILLRLKEEYGFDFIYRFFSVFLPATEPLEIALNTDTDIATYFVAVCSAASKNDLRERFGNTWGFPVDDIFFAKNYPAVQIAVNQRCGDIDSNDNVELADAIHALKIIAGMNVSGINFNADVNGDGKIGMHEVIYILQRVTGIR